MSRTVPPGEILDHDEIALLRRGLGEWGGPARPSRSLAVALGAEDPADLLEQCGRLRSALAADQPLAPLDWARVLFAVEIVFASDLQGSGVDWPTTTGYSDQETITALRVIQRKLGPVLRDVYGQSLSRNP
ncbi:hypothetical protein ACWGH8_29850 [Nonomuraea muscovyensis]|uniref:Uncharacterized protein n=1 Tax=Nonomuraea muscovyensis TaxID=1124761 RepID=A0A7X0F191_9ACTN|nr:hypothetical protein [Nonomuraea muscovyensis]MBB6352157.1 hypothetical protein [Nonomuraea muscovyensis]MDF2706748.1 hypothetical protein [Nonomuraea muscovyensis]